MAGLPLAHMYVKVRSFSTVYKNIEIETPSFRTRLRTHNQKMTVAAMQMALKKVWAHRS